MSGTNKRKMRTAKRPSHVPVELGLGGTAWYYEQRSGVRVYVEARDKDGKWVATTSVVVPWHVLAKSAPRCGWTLRREADR